MSELWTRWQGYLVNGLYPLGRYLGSSDHSGVFLTRSAARGASELAIKLVPADRAVAESLLPRWKRAGGLNHPNLLRLHEWGGCQLEGSPYLYVMMDYADQTLAQLLQSRALTETEAREMLVPVLDALAFLHGRDLVQGQLKPANILVKGDQLQLASDTVRRVGERGPTAHARTQYDPPEALHGTGSYAGDIWAFGVSLCEALTRHPPAITGEYAESVALPAEIAQSFRHIVARCLSRRPQDRPVLSELLAWAGGSSESPPAPAASLEPVELDRAEPKPDDEVMRPPPPEPEAPRVPVGLILGAVLSLGLLWAGWHLFGRHPASAAASPAALAPASGTIARAPDNATHPDSALSPTTPSKSIATATLQPIREVIPDVPLNARRTIRGHIKVWVKVSIDQDGSVADAVAYRPGPSRYFQRLALQAARRWTFPPAADSSRRLMQLQFEFSRDGTRARSAPLH